MFQFSATARITAGLVCLIASLLFCAQTLGLVPDEAAIKVAARARLCETIAINHSVHANRGDTEGIAASLDAIVSRNDEIRSAAVRLSDGRVLASAGPHAVEWQPVSTRSTDTHVFVPLFKGKSRWATVEIRFDPLVPEGWFGWLMQPFAKLVLFVVVTSLVVLFFYLRRMLVQLDPSRVVPDRVRRAFDTLAEGVVILDDHERIVLANSVFSSAVGIEPSRLQGRPLGSVEGFESDRVCPSAWQPAVKEARPCTGTTITVRGADGDVRKFQVNASPILGDKGASRGALVSFDDVTPLERKREELKRMVDLLRQSGEEIRRQNAELEILATRDPLTNCLNRRSFFVKFEENWGLATAQSRPLSGVMVDVDHFKSINDNHGHAKGDEVLATVGRLLNEAAREGDVVCRYGGEEFCILFPDTDVATAVELAENVRRTLESTEIGGLHITASLGVSGIELGATSPDDMLDQADQCLYVAKRNGRNQVVSFADVPEGEAERDEERDESSANESTTDSDALAIPFHAVTALFSALSYRDHVTAEHSRRVADLCVAVGRRVLGRRACYTLETAALLHDIGKIGVPDAILLKPGPLTEDEWVVMHEHDHYGVEIVRAAFQSPELSAIIENHHAFFGGIERRPDAPSGSDIPLGARVLAIADAYDAMVSDRCYRKGRPRAAAFEELRRCAGSQFDPRLVELFVDTVERLPPDHGQSGTGVSKELALAIGMQMERLVDAIEDADVELLSSLATRLEATASRNGLERLANKANELLRSIGQGDDPSRLVTTAGDLLDICRATQSAFLADDAADRSAFVGVASTAT